MLQLFHHQRYRQLQVVLYVRCQQHEEQHNREEKEDVPEGLLESLSLDLLRYPNRFR
jgi:hypothetical protein